MKKNKFLKTLGFSCMAVFMASLTILGGCSAPQLNNNVDKPPVSSSLGLDPKNDPVVYTTDSGLEIKMSNAFATKQGKTTTLSSNKNVSYTQNLTSFYYFTMGTYSGTIYTATNATATYSVSNEPVNWIILGLGKNSAYFLDQVTQNLFSTWKTNIEGIDHSNTTSNNYFFKEIYETVSPAGNAIYSELATKAYIMEKVKASIPVNPGNLNEIPEGCMLVLSEKLLGQMYFNSKGNLNSGSNYDFGLTYIIASSGGYYGNRYRYIGNSNTGTNGTSGQSWTTSGNAGGSLYNYINNLFSKNTSGTILENSLGFTQSQADLIVPQQLYTFYSNGSTEYTESYSTDSSTYYSMFPLAHKAVTSKTQTFCLETYLSQNYRIAALIGSNQAYDWHLRSGVSTSTNSFGPVRYNMTVAIDGQCLVSNVSNTMGVRPAMVMRLS